MLRPLRHLRALHAGGAALPVVDKSGAIADLLGGMHCHANCFFARPRGFGKSQTLSVAGEMLAAGALPPGVTPWPGYVPVDAALFGGLQVHERLQKGDATLRGLLQRPHFVVKLGLGEARTGAELDAVIKKSIADIAAQAFGEAVGRKVLQRANPSGALGVLVRAVPSAVPVALLVDDYDAAIIQDVSKGDWAAANAGRKALYSLTMSVKCPNTGPRIERCLVTGVARLMNESLANTFRDHTDDLLLSRVLGFSEAEIRATFPAELERLAGAQGTDVSGAMQQLAHWYSGHCFDGASTCFNPSPVLAALQQGRITHRALEASSGSTWLGLTQGKLVMGLVQGLQQGWAMTDIHGRGIIDLAQRRVRAVPLLLQTGLLSVVPPQPLPLPLPLPLPRLLPLRQPLQCHPPNEYARLSLHQVLQSAVEGAGADGKCLGLAMGELQAALRLRSPGAFGKAVTALLLLLPSALLVGATHTDKGAHEACFHASLACALLASAQEGMQVDLEPGTAGGREGIIVRFGDAAWVLDVGVGGGSVARLGLAQARGAAQPEQSVLCCAVQVASKGSAGTVGAASVPPVKVTCTWSERTVAPAGAAGGWAWSKLV